MITVIRITSLILALVGAGLTFYLLGRKKKVSEKKKILFSILAFVLVFLGLGTLLNTVLLPAAIGVGVNMLLYKILKRNWSTLLIAIPLTIPVAMLLALIAEAYLALINLSASSVGDALGLIILVSLGVLYYVVIGSISYFISVIGTSIARIIIKHEKK